jgi:hypothetical protein
MMRPVVFILTIAVMWFGAACGTEDGGSDVGTRLACEEVAESADAILLDPASHPGELGSIVGAAGASDDPVLRAAAEEFDREGSDLVGAFLDIVERCKTLGLA